MVNRPNQPDPSPPPASAGADGAAPDASVGGEDHAQHLHALGAETHTERAVKRIVPWVVSIAAHAALVALGFLITWTVVMLQDEQAAPVIVADFDAPAYDALASLEAPVTDAVEPTVQDRVEVQSYELTDSLLDAPAEPLDLYSDAASIGPTAPFASEPSPGAAEFLGVRASNARRIVYVIDASGSMITWLQTVLEGLIRSIDKLRPEQDFGVVFSKGEEVLVVPPEDRLIIATPDEKLRAYEWIDENIIAGGSSEPINAIERALKFKPDVIFLLSTNITGSGIFELDQDELLRQLDELNPIDPATGRRATQINCIQFLDPDPLDTLRLIAEHHGGPNGYKFLDREELGIAE